MIEADFCPIVIRVTTRAIRTVVPLVFIVIEVATHAIHLQLIAEWVVAMTRVTAQVGVATQQVEVGIAKMVEARVGPGLFVVAIATLFAASAFVNIIRGMTPVAIRWRILVRLVFVTPGTFHVLMHSDKREIGRVVVKFEFGPVVWIVAVGACRS
jgi:hypothetical protein